MSRVNPFLGSPHELETLDGKIRINVKAGTEIGHILRVPKKGLTRDNYTGDMMVEVWLDIPKDIDDENKRWTILYKNDYYYEERFTIFGSERRLTSIEIIKNIFQGNL